MDLVKPLERYKELNKNLNDDENQTIDQIILIITKHEKRRRKKLILINYFSKISTEILIMILFMNHKKECNRGHKWCANDKPNHRYSNRQIIFRLMEVCKEWYNILAPYVYNEIILNKEFLDFNEQKRSLQFTKLVNSERPVFVNFITKIIIYDNFFFNSTMLKIIDICQNLKILVLRYSTILSESFNGPFRTRLDNFSEIIFDNDFEIFNFERNFSKNLIRYYKTNNYICRSHNGCNEPIYWGKYIYWNFCTNHKGEMSNQRRGWKISEVNWQQ